MKFHENPIGSLEMYKIKFNSGTDKWTLDGQMHNGYKAMTQVLWPLDSRANKK